ncbi:MAG TPA: pyrimidine dimer DNA glycosylase/endonuclease V [Nitrosopumilaceae archaeon]|nr:pyrimidine dimer DNA glycosylase/endonuclease V [Nitrosopumilaceae archaeon]
MRIWDIAPEKLCKNHLLGEHRELHAIWSILTQGKTGYSRHPETLRWIGKLKALYFRHQSLVLELSKRGYKHHSPLPFDLATGSEKQDQKVDSYEDQVRNLKKKGCKCNI